MSLIKEVDVFYEQLKNKSLSAFKEIDKRGKIIERKWDTPFGLMEVRLFMGEVFEKAGVSYSSLRIKHPKTGVEVDVRVFEILAYMSNPRVPTCAISLRYRFDGGDNFMGCSDIAQSVIIEEDQKLYEDRMSELAKKYGKDFGKLRERSFELFTSKYTGKHVLGGRGYGFDLPGDGFDFFRECGEIFLDSSLTIIRKRKDEPYIDAEKDKQLHDRGKWVEFNLMEDKGFILGVQAGVPPEAMNFQTLPPVAKFYP